MSKKRAQQVWDYVEKNPPTYPTICIKCGKTFQRKANFSLVCPECCATRAESHDAQAQV